MISRLAPWLTLVGLGMLGLLLVRRDRDQERRLDALTALVQQMAARPLPLPIVSGGERVVAPNVEALAARIAELVKAQSSSTSVARAGAGSELLPEQSAALEATRQLLGTAMARGVLTRENVLEMRRHLVELNSPEEARELKRQIAVALNTGKLVPENPHFIFP